MRGSILLSCPGTLLLITPVDKQDLLSVLSQSFLTSSQRYLPSSRDDVWLCC